MFRTYLVVFLCVYSPYSAIKVKLIGYISSEHPKATTMVTAGAYPRIRPWFDARWTGGAVQHLLERGLAVCLHRATCRRCAVACALPRSRRLHVSRLRVVIQAAFPRPTYLPRATTRKLPMLLQPSASYLDVTIVSCVATVANTVSRSVGAAAARDLVSVTTLLDGNECIHLCARISLALVLYS